MEKRLGISVYPHKASVEKNIEYIDLAHSLGYKRIFSCMLSIGNSKEALKDFKTVMKHANKRGFEVFFDIAPAVLKDLKVSTEDLSFFKKLGATGLRLDVGYDGSKESILTFNEEGLSIELNISNDVPYLDMINSYKPNLNRLQGCHNFYPQKYTALSYDYFISASKRFKNLGLRTAAFVHSKNATDGPWLINDGLCTLEKHRNLPITTQAKELWATGLIDDVIIGDAFASKEELEALSKINPDVIELEVEWDKNTTEAEKLLTSMLHFRRGDMNEYFIRSTMSRVKYKDAVIEPRGYSGNQRLGDIFTGNNNFGHYKGEIQICIKEVENDNRKNLLGKIKEDNLVLLPYIDAWKKFLLK